MDKILMQGMEFFGYHGVFEDEKVKGQRFIVDLEIVTNTKEAGENDDLQKTINYGELYYKIKKIVEEERYDLIEALAEKIAQVVLKEERAYEVLVRIKKPQAPVRGNFEYMGVEIIRRCDCETSCSLYK